jgi:hypothetical protein
MKIDIFQWSLIVICDIISFLVDEWSEMKIELNLLKERFLKRLDVKLMILKKFEK